jgi:glycosyltransferase involved in cell wall biosynthesis
MRILQVITPSKIAGAERSTASLCEHLVRAGHRVTIATKQGHPLVDLLRSLDLDVRPMPLSGKANVAAGLRLARLARSLEAEVIHTQLSTAALWGSVGAHLAGIPAVAHVRALNSKTCYTLADRVIAISEAVRDHLVAQGMAGDRIDVVYSGIDPRRYSMPVPREEARRALEIPPDAVVLGVLAHLTAKKGHHVLLPALAELKPQFPRLLTLLAGDGVERGRLEEQARHLGLTEQVRFLGFREDVLPVYAALEFLVLPSVAGEGLPRALLEAGFLGLPVVGTRLSGVPEIVRDGETGYVVPPGDAPALAARLRDLLACPSRRAQFGATAKEWIRGKFTIEAMVEGTLRSYRKAGAGAWRGDS